MVKLNLGCGQNKLEGYINVDKFPTYSPEKVWDLETFPWPFEENSVDEIIMSHCLEHMGAKTEVFFAIIQELYRISRNNANILIAVPHPRSDNFINDPTHVRIITENTMNLFSKKKNQEWKEMGVADSPLAHYLNVDFEIEKTNYLFSDYWVEKHKKNPMSADDLAFAIQSYNNVISEIHIRLCVRK